MTAALPLTAEHSAKLSDAFAAFTPVLSSPVLNETIGRTVVCNAEASRYAASGARYDR